MLDKVFIQSCYAMLPGVEIVTIQRKQGTGANPDPLTSGDQVKAREVEITVNDMQMSNLLSIVDYIKLQIFDDGSYSPFVPPAYGDRIIRADGTTWTVNSYPRDLMGTMYECICAAEAPQ